MRTYSKTTIIIKTPFGPLCHDIETWTEHNHASIYSDGAPLFDGYAPQGHAAKKAEINRIAEIAARNGYSIEIK